MKSKALTSILLVTLLVACSHSAVEPSISPHSLNSVVLHGDTLTISPVMSECTAPYPFGFQKPLDEYQRDYPFLHITRLAEYQGKPYYYELKNKNNLIVLENPYDDDIYTVIYADISDKRITIKPGIHTQQTRKTVLKKLHASKASQDFRVLEVDGGLYERTTFIFNNNVLRRIVVQSNNQSIRNPAPFGYMEAGRLRGWRGEKLFANKGANFLESVCFTNERGDTIVPFGKYEYVGCDSIAPIGIVAEPNHGLVALNTRGEKLFGVMQIDNFEPDIVCDGRFRIIGDNGLTGYADTLGNIIVQPQYQCALPFNGGRAKVARRGWKNDENDEHWYWMSDEWFYIDTNGRRLPDVAEQDKR